MPGQFVIDKKKAEMLLAQLGEALEDMDAEPVEILVSGAMSLLLQGMVNRPTTDIDGIGFVLAEEGGLVLEKPSMQQAFREARARVATANNLPARWLNFQSRTLMDNGLPDGILERALISDYGSKFRIRLCSRLDMIALKMWAAIDVTREVDLVDLRVLRVTRREAEFGITYCLQNSAQRERLSEVLEAIGHGKLARELFQ
jgi:hypothetical protein